MGRSLLLGVCLVALALPARAQDASEGAGAERAPSSDAGPRPPSLVDAPEVHLPLDAEPLPAGEGAVVLVLTIDERGLVTHVEVAEGLRADVDALVLDAAHRMRFSPATRDGTPVSARVRFRYRVAIPAAAEDAATSDESGGDASSDESGSDGSSDHESSADESSADESSDDESSDESSDDSAEDEELGVTAIVEPEEEGAASRITLRGEELTTVPGTFGEPLRAVASLPGVARSPFGLGFFLVRGSNFQNTGFMVDGFQVPLLYHVGAGPAILANRWVESLRFYAGNYPVRYGRFGGGLISLQTRIPNVPSPEGQASIDAARASGLVIVPFAEGRGAVAAAFRRSYFELIVPFIQPGLDVAFMDYQALGRYRVDDHLELSFFFFGADDYLDQSGQIGDGGFLSEGSRSSASFDLQRLIATLRVRLDGGTRLTLSSMIGRDASGFDTSQPGFGLLRFELEAFFAGWRFEAFLPVTENLRTRVGIDVNTLNAHILGTAPVPPGLGEQPRPLPALATSDADLGVVQAFAAAYVEQIFAFDPLEVSAGIRLDLMHWGEVTELVPDPRAVVRLRVHPMVTLKAAGGLFAQQPSPFTIFRVGGNPAIPPERAWQSSAGVELGLPYGIEAWATGFYNRMWNIARGVDRVVPTERGLRRVFFVPDEEGQSYGVEAMLRLRRDGFYGWITYTLSRSERWTPERAADLFAFDQTHVLNVVASYGFEGWRFGLRFSLATGRPARGVQGARLDADTGGYSARFGSLDERLPYSHQLDVRIDRAFDLGPVTGSVYLDVLNVYFSELPEGRLYQYDYRAQGLLRGLPIIPSIGIRGTLR